jgi:hypothetical protein
MTEDGAADVGPVQAQDSCDWCYRASSDASRAESEHLGLVAENVYACGSCLAAKMYRKEPPQGWAEDVVWPWLKCSADDA